MPPSRPRAERTMRLEHIAVDVADPAAFKDWWTRHLGMRISTANDAFLTDDSGVGESHLEPIVGKYEVKLLQDLIVEIIGRYR